MVIMSRAGCLAFSLSYYGCVVHRDSKKNTLLDYEGKTWGVRGEVASSGF